VLADPEGNRFCVIDRSSTYLETERLRLRCLTPGDEAAVLALHSDPAVMRHLGPPATEVDMSFYTAFYDRYPAFGYWAAIEKATGAFLGWFLFRPPRENPQPGTIELGYRLHTAAWGRGFATEGAVALIDKGFTELGVERVVADTMTVNTGSRRVMEKAGLRFVRTFRYPGSDLLEGGEHGDVEYALTREEWSRAGGPGRGAARRPR
jgi:RimJ/RimL family protein N-acetyltransferase